MDSRDRLWRSPHRHEPASCCATARISAGCNTRLVALDVDDDLLPGPTALDRDLGDAVGARGVLRRVIIAAWP